jgi:hypothetical protein
LVKNTHAFAMSFPQSFGNLTSDAQDPGIYSDFGWSPGLTRIHSSVPFRTGIGMTTGSSTSNSRSSDRGALGSFFHLEAAEQVVYFGLERFRLAVKQTGVRFLPYTFPFRMP